MCGQKNQKVVACMSCLWLIDDVCVDELIGVFWEHTIKKQNRTQKLLSCWSEFSSGPREKGNIPWLILGSCNAW